MRRIPLTLAVLALVTGLGLIAAVYLTGQPDKPAFTTASGAGATAAEPTSPAAASPSAISPRPSPPPTKAPTVYRFPVQGLASYARTHHDYPASDIMAPCGNTVVSPVDGVVLEVTRVDTWDPQVNAGATRGGLSWSVLGDDGARYYGSHLSSIDARVNPGVRVKAGQRLGKIGKTGDTTACHLHFGISPVCKRTGDWWIRRGVIWPWSYLDAWRKGTPKSPVATVKAWQAEHGCPSKPLVNP